MTTAEGSPLVRQRSEVADSVLAAVMRLRWSKERLAAERRRRLRELVTYAKDRSEFHRHRLRDVECEDLDEGALTELPVMTKQDLMANFDAAVTDPRLTLAKVDDHIERLTSQPGGDAEDEYLLGEYRAVATGGTSGLRGLFVYGWNDWVQFAALERRWRVRLADQIPLPAAGRIGSLFANKTAHISGALHAFAADPDLPICHVPVTMPLDQIVAGLNSAQPVWLQGYPTAILLLSGEARQGRLRISPTHIKTCGELLTEDTREAARDAWGVEIHDSWGASEGVYAFSCGRTPTMHLPDDLCIIEPVDHAGRPVAPGNRADKIYLTNLYNFTQPLIRYELTDSMTVFDDPCACGCEHRRIGDLEGRLDDMLAYPGGIVVHSVGLCAAMLGARRVVEYQMIQTQRGVSVRVRTEGAEDLDAVRTSVERVLSTAGLANPDVVVTEADGLDRLWSGKLRRFVPLPG